jgi:branched-chain amino acid transport system ATP-binding protein
VTKIFGGFPALRDVSLTLTKGETLGVIGPNGSGKSTLINIISGFFPPDSGKVVFHGIDLTGQPMDTHVRQGIARTYQIPKTFKGFSVSDCVRLAVISSERDLDDPGEVVEYVLRLTGLFNQRHIPAEKLSQGCLRRLELARAIGTGATLYLFDEVFSALSVGDAAEMKSLIQRMHLEREVSFILVSHNLSIVEEFCDRALLLEDGRVSFDGPPGSLGKVLS